MGRLFVAATVANAVVWAPYFGDRVSGPAGERGIGGGTPSVPSGPTLLDPAVVDELVTAEPTAFGRVNLTYRLRADGAKD